MVFIWVQHILSTNCHRSWSGPKPGFPGILTGAATDYRRRKCNNKISCTECVMSCGAWGTTSLKSPHISLHKPISKDLSFVDTAVFVKLQQCFSSHLLKISLLASALFEHQRISCCTFCYSCLVSACNLGPDWAASVPGSWDRLIIVDKGSTKGLSWCLCVGGGGGGAVTKTLHNKIPGDLLAFHVEEEEENKT